MFKKNFKIKNNCQLKNSDKRKLYANILSSFKSLTEEDLSLSFPPKECVNQMKLLTNQGEHVQVYLCTGKPLILDLGTRIVPTIYFLWIHTNIMPTYTVTQFVLDKLIGGAELMLPGIIREDGPNPYGQVNKGDVVGITVNGNRIPLAVGVTLMSSEEMLSSDGYGKAVTIIHTINDSLCQRLNETLEKPPTEEVTSEELEKPIVENIDITQDKTVEVPIEEGMLEGKSENLTQLTANLTIDKIDNPDEVLKKCFLRTLKLSDNKIALPILTNLFYKNHMLRNIPADTDFDIKKTKYKKLSTFLAEMENAGIIKLQTTQKNAQSIIDIDYKHQLLLEFNDTVRVIHETPTTVEEGTNIEVIETYVVNAQVLPLLSKMNYEKGDCLIGQDLRAAVTEYIKKERLQNPANKTLVNLDPILTNVIRANVEKIEWRVLMEKVIDNMGNHYEIKKNGITIASAKGKIPIIDICVRTRSGNKKVTLVDNLEIYGVNLQVLSRECQHALAASTTLNKVPNKKMYQFQVQGSHVSYIAKLLIDKYSIPKKYINEGAEGSKKN